MRTHLGQAPQRARDQGALWVERGGSSRRGGGAGRQSPHPGGGAFTWAESWRLTTAFAPRRPGLSLFLSRASFPGTKAGPPLTGEEVLRADTVPTGRATEVPPTCVWYQLKNPFLSFHWVSPPTAFWVKWFLRSPELKGVSSRFQDKRPRLPGKGTVK